MEKRSVYTPSNDKDIGAFREDALSVADAEEAASASETDIDAMMADLLGSMNRLATDEATRKAVGRMLV